MLNDLRYAIRMLTKNAGFSIVAVVTLALGIGANTAIFTAFNAVALRPIQATKPERLVNIDVSTPQDRYGGRAFSYPNYVHYRDHNSVFSGLIAWSGTGLTLNAAPGVSNIGAAGGGISAIAGIRFFQQMAGSAELIRAALVSENYFSELGINPAMGRTFIPEEARAAYPVVMLSYNFWERRFNSDREILGKTVKLNGKPFTVVGLTPKDFIGTYQNVPSVWLPIGAFPLLELGRDVIRNREDNCCELIGRLKPAVTREKAQAEMTVLADRWRRTYLPGSEKREPVGITLTPGSPFGFRPTAEVMTVVGLVMGAVGLVLLIACANVAGLQLAKSLVR